MLRKSVALQGIAPNQERGIKLRGGLFNPLAAASILGAGIVLSPGEAAAFICGSADKGNPGVVGDASGADDGNVLTNTACGNNAQADPAGGTATAVGNESDARAVGATALGNEADAFATDSTAVGNNASVVGVTPDTGSEGGIAVGHGALVGFDPVTGTPSDAPRAIAIGSEGPDAETRGGAIALGADAIAIGTDALASGVDSIAIGRGAVATTSIAIGAGAMATGTASTAFGDNAQATATNTSAFGENALASADNSTALGANAKATGFASTAVGANTEAAFAGSAAFGSDDLGNPAVATRDRQQVFGTTRNTYTMPGITSNESLSRQTVGAVEVVTSDQNGNLATDGGFILQDLIRGRSELREGVAVALATEDPDLVGNERFALKFNWGNFEGENALALTAAASFGRSIFVPGDRLTLSGGAGFGLEHNTVGARVGLQLSWGGAPEFTTPGFPPLK